MRAASSVSLVLVLAACGREPLTALVPFRPEDQSAVLIIEREQNVAAFAVDAALREETPVLLHDALSSSQSMRATALFYGAPLAALGFQRGPIELISDPARGHPLPSSTGRILRAELAFDTQQPEWSTLAALPTELEALRVPREESCVRFEVRDFSLRDETVFIGAARESANAAIVAVASATIAESRLYRVDTGGARPLPRAQELVGFRAEHVAGGADAIFLSGTISASIAIAYRSADGAYTILDPRPADTRSVPVRAMVAPPAGAEDASLIYVVDTRGDVDRWVVESLANPHWGYRPLNLDVRTGDGSAAAWNAARDIYFLSADGTDIFRFKDGAYLVESVMIGGRLHSGDDRLSTLAAIPGLGAFAATDSGTVLALSGGSWDQLRTGRGTKRIETIAPFRDGLLIGTSHGELLQYHPSTGFCETSTFLSGESALSSVIELERAVVVAGFDRAAARVFVSILTPVDPE